MKKSLLFALIIAAAVLMLPTGLRADCPDKMICLNCAASTGDGCPKVGTIDTPTCWKFAHGCKPWHCDGGNKKDEHACKNLCRAKFKELKNVSDNDIFLEFPRF